MTDKKISNFELGTLNYFLIRAYLIGITFNILINSTKQDSWIIPIISIIPAILIIFLVDYIMKYKTNLNIADKIISLFNKKIGIVFLILLLIIIAPLSIINFLNINNFIQSQFLNKTPLLVISIIFMLSSFYVVNKGINVISRTSNILFYISFILVILSFIGLIPNFKIDNLKPFFTCSKNYFYASNGFYALNILPIFFLTIIPNDYFKNKRIKKTLIISYIVSIISIFLIIFQTISTFGYELTKLYEYPEFFVLKHVKLINLSSRLESILIIQLIFDMFIYNTFSIYFIGNSLESIFNKKQINKPYLFVCVLIVIITMIISRYNFYIDESLYNLIATTTSIIITTIIILVCLKIKMNKK